MEAMISNDDEKAWMSPLLDFRNRFGDEEHDRERRSFRKMQGYLQGSYKQLHHGPYLKKYREQWLRELLEIQKDITTSGPVEFSDLELISMEELRNIRRIWVFDKHEFDDSLPSIYERVTGKKFIDPEWIHIESFGKKEWDILSSVCEELFGEEELAFEMMYTLIDIENRASGLSQYLGSA
jgi:DNA sulfur modification protein DndC